MTETRWPIWTHFPLQLRPGTSDADVYAQIFTGLAYAAIDHDIAPELVIDCGAYTGLSGAYFLSRWPACHLVAVEPDPGNARLCGLNLKPYGRAVVHRAAVWSHDWGVAPSAARYRDGREWSRQVREHAADDLVSVPSLDLNSLVPAHGRTLVKMDVEGAEAAIFSAPDLSWIGRIERLAIEVHDDSTSGPCSEIVARAMRSRGFTGSQHGELTLYRKAH